MLTHLQNNLRPLGASCLLAGISFLALPNTRAAYHPTTGERQNIARLIADLEAIKNGSQVTTAEKTALAADLELLATSTTKPSSATVGQLASDLASAFADGSLSTAEKAKLVLDVDAVFNSAGLTTDEATQFISDIQAILASSGIDAADVELIASDLAAITANLQSSFIATDTTFTLKHPTVSSASAAHAPLGRAQLTTSQRDDGTDNVHLALETLGLATGTYSVNATTSAGGAPVVLGSFKVQGRASIGGVGAIVFGDGSKNAFPTGFKAAALAAVSVVNSAGAVQLSGSTADAAKVSRLGNLALKAGTAYPDATGHVAFATAEKHGKSKSHFLLFARQLPVSATLTLKVNGTTVGQVDSDAKGRLLITEGKVVAPVSGNGIRPVTKPMKLPEGVDVNAIKTLELDDAQSQVVATAGLD